jgi:soluble lytic murein transglycosylase-like protein
MPALYGITGSDMQVHRRARAAGLTPPSSNVSMRLREDARYRGRSMGVGRGLLATVLVGAIWCASTGAAEALDGAAASPYRLDSRLRPAYALKGYWGPTAKVERMAPTSRKPGGRQLLAHPYAKEIERAAREAGVDPALVHAIVFVESGYDAKARSPKGAVGLMQVLPETAARFGVRDPRQSPEANLRAGTRYLRALMTLFNNRLDLVLAAYNAGENSVLGHGGAIPPYPETRAYVPAVLSKYREWRRGDLSSERRDLRRAYMPVATLNAKNAATAEEP